MSRLAMKALAAATLSILALTANAQDVLIRNAKVHTAGAQGTLENADVLVTGGMVRQVGPGLSAPAGAQTVDAQGRPLTPTLFGGITGIGIEEVSGERDTVDASLTWAAARPD